ncbi:MAG: YkgJ family cysteine cluster protein [Chitinophagaceae bacterium]|nr:MAG: YkgJ family cysteine cluster protein [Chitinophagaceae bacterium]
MQNENLNVNSQNIKEHAAKKLKENRKFLNNLKKNSNKKLLKIVPQIHDEVFEKTNCLECANCCKTISPVFKERDIKRISKLFNLNDKSFIATYLFLDEDNEYVLQQTPCVFLGDDNKCLIYDSRPEACRHYPHTDKKPLLKIKNLTLKNSAVCPAVYNILERLKDVS